MMNNLTASWLSVTRKNLTKVRSNYFFLTALSTKIFHEVHEELGLCSFLISAQRWRPEAKRTSGSRDMASQRCAKKPPSGPDLNPGPRPWARLHVSLFTPYLMNTSCHDVLSHIVMFAIWCCINWDIPDHCWLDGSPVIRGQMKTGWEHATWVGSSCIS